jgi:hypothetical protein
MRTLSEEAGNRWHATRNPHLGKGRRPVRRALQDGIGSGDVGKHMPVFSLLLDVQRRCESICGLSADWALGPVARERGEAQGPPRE